MDVRLTRCSPGCQLVLSGGDDNALAVTALQVDHVVGCGPVDTSHLIHLLWQVLEPCSHSSALTG